MSAEENTCTECDRVNPVWFAPNDLWNKVMGSDAGFLCPICFIEKAEVGGLVPTAWVLDLEQIDQRCGSLLEGIGTGQRYVCELPPDHRGHHQMLHTPGYPPCTWEVLIQK